MKKKSERLRRKKVLLRYNRSVYYVDTVWALAEKLNKNISVND